MQARHSAASQSARAILRRHTKDAHLRLHELEVFRVLVSGTLERRHYSRLMASLHAYYRLADDVLASACMRFRAHEHGYSYHARAPLFAQDLSALGVEFVPAPRAAEVLPAIASAAALAGALYVVEGSLLGGATLDGAASRLLASSDSGDTHGRRYWAWCREVGGSRWQTTIELIDGWLATPAQTHSAVAAARATFDQLHDCLCAQAAAQC